MRKFRRLPESSIPNIEELGHRTELRIHYGPVKLRARPGERFRLGDRVGKRFRGFQQILALVLVGVSDSEQHAAKPGASLLILGRKIGAAKKRFAVWHQESGERPTALSADRADR